MKLNFRFRYALYAAFSALFLSGIFWLAADSLKDAPGWGNLSGDGRQSPYASRRSSDGDAHVAGGAGPRSRASILARPKKQGYRRFDGGAQCDPRRNSLRAVLPRRRVAAALDERHSSGRGLCAACSSVYPHPLWKAREAEIAGLKGLLYQSPLSSHISGPSAG